MSSRHESDYFSIPNYDNTKTTNIASDPLFTFPVDQDTGLLGAPTASPAGGQTPRQFAINKAGNLVAVGLQDDDRVVVIRRDIATGALGDIIAHATVEGGVTCAIFDE